MISILNILIRTSNRPSLFKRCYNSIISQTAPAKIIVGYDNDEALSYIPEGIEKYKVSANTDIPFFYDLYVNDLIQKVNDGWIIVIDDDDYLAGNTVIEELMQHLTDPDQPVICQFLRWGRPKPNKHEIANEVILEGKIGLPCLVLHSKHKNIACLDGKKAGDYRFIKSISEQLKCKFVELVVVETDRRSFGKMEKEERKEVNS